MERIEEAKAAGTYNPMNPSESYLDTNEGEGEEEEGSDSDSELWVAKPNKSGNGSSSKPGMGFKLRMSKVGDPRVSSSKPVAGAYTPIGEQPLCTLEATCNARPGPHSCELGRQLQVNQCSCSLHAIRYSTLTPKAAVCNHMYVGAFFYFGCR